MNLKNLMGMAGQGVSLIGHALGVKEFLETFMGLFTASSALAGIPQAPKGTEEERHFAALLGQIEKEKAEIKWALLAFMHRYYIPPPNTGRFGRRAYEIAHQDFMKQVTTLPVRTGSSPRIWLMNLGERLHVGGEPAYAKIKEQLEAERFPFPPQVSFDEQVNNLHMRMLEAKRKKGFLHRFVRDWL